MRPPSCKSNNLRFILNLILNLILILNLSLIPHPLLTNLRALGDLGVRSFSVPKKNGLKAFDLQPVSQKRCPLWSHHLKANKLPVRPIWYCAG